MKDMSNCCTKNEVSIKDFVSKCDQICSFLWICSLVTESLHLPKIDVFHCQK